MDWQTSIGTPFAVRVIPKSSSNRIKAETMPDGAIRIRVYVTVVAEAGKANEMVLKLLAKALKLPKSALTILRGELSQDKIIKIRNYLVRLLLIIFGNPFIMQ